MKTDEERNLLQSLASGAMDGLVGSDLQSGRSTVWKVIKDGVPMMLKQGPGKRIFDGKENIRIEGKTQVLQKWVTDTEKLDFFRKYGWLMKDAAVKAYSAKFKPTK